MNSYGISWMALLSCEAIMETRRAVLKQACLRVSAQEGI
jgi:hypothetical protein